MLLGLALLLLGLLLLLVLLPLALLLRHVGGMCRSLLPPLLFREGCLLPVPLLLPDAERLFLVLPPLGLLGSRGAGCGRRPCCVPVGRHGLLLRPGSGNGGRVPLRRLRHRRRRSPIQLLGDFLQIRPLHPVRLDAGPVRQGAELLDGHAGSPARRSRSRSRPVRRSRRR